MSMQQSEHSVAAAGPATLPHVCEGACLLPLPGCADCTLLLVAPEACRGALGVAAACNCCFSASTSCNE